MLGIFKKLSIILLITIFFQPLMIAGAQDFDVNASQAIIMEASTGQVLYAKNIDDRVEPASLVKLMSMLLIMEAIEGGEIELDDVVMTSENAASKGGSQIWLEPGERMTVETLLKTVAVVSANDSTVALAEYIAGTEDNFVRLMNERAEELGLENTQFANSTGLPTDRGEQYISLRDAAEIGRLLVEYQLVLDLSSIWIEYIREGASMLRNTNDLIHHYPGADGLKTGWTSTSGYHLLGTVDRDGFRLLSGVLGTDSNQIRMEEVIKLLNYGFRAFEFAQLVEEGENMGEIELPLGIEEEVEVISSKSLEVVIQRGRRGEISQSIESHDISAPVEKGQELGELVFMQEERELGRVPLLAAEDVRRAGLWTRFMRWLRGLMLSLFR